MDALLEPTNSNSLPETQVAFIVANEGEVKEINSQEILLPTMNDLPELYREKSKKRVDRMNIYEKRFSFLETRVDMVEETVTQVSNHYELIKTQLLDSEQILKDTNDVKTKIENEIRILADARKILIDGGDATPLLDFPSHMANEMYKYGKVKTPLQWLKQSQWKKQTNYTEGKQKFDEYQWSRFYNKTRNVEEIVRNYIGSQDDNIKMPQLNNLDLESENLSDQLSRFNKESASQIDGYLGQLKKSGTQVAVMQNIENWLNEDWVKDVDFSTKWDTEPVGVEHLRDTVDYYKRTSNVKVKKLDDWIGSYKHSVRNYVGSVFGEMLNAGKEIISDIQEPKFNFSETTVLGVMPEEYLFSLRFCGSSVDDYKAVSKLNDHVQSFVSKHNLTLDIQRSEFNSIKRILDGLSKANKEFPESKDLFWHVASIDTLAEKVISPGLLLSRAEQMKMFGEANFASAGMQVSKLDDGNYKLTKKNSSDGTSWSKNMNLSELKQERGWGQKPWFSEYNQLCFSKDYSYFGDSLEIGLCFSKVSLLSNRQFMLADGWHVFDGEYQGSPESKGFSINLKDEPHLLVMVKENALPKLKEKLQQKSEDGNILGNSIAIDDWIEKHVMVVKSMVGEDVRQRVKAEFDKRFSVNSKKGFFMPSGISSPEKPGVWEKQPLVMYKTL